MIYVILLPPRSRAAFLSYGPICSVKQRLYSRDNFISYWVRAEIMEAFHADYDLLVHLEGACENALHSGVR